MTATKQLINERMPRGALDKFVMQRRAAGIGWRVIARDIQGQTGVHVSHETLRSWYPNDRSGSAAKTSAA